MRDDLNERDETQPALDPRLAALLHELPREQEPSRLLEERTVQALRATGALANHRRGLPPAWIAAGFAASVALFACGAVTGQWLGGRQAAAALAAQQQASLDEITAVVERTGSAYVLAMSQLAEKNAVPGSPQTRQARETALQILHQAANEVVRMAPNDPVTVKILQGFEHAARQATPADARERRREIMWF